MKYFLIPMVKKVKKILRFKNQIWINFKINLIFDVKFY